MRFWTLILLLSFAIGAHAQNIRESSHFHGSLRRAGERAAEKQKVADWPQVKDLETGTQVHVTFDYRNSDIILLAYPLPGREKMLAVGRRIANALKMPKADYIFVEDETYGSIDVEFNKYLTERDKTHSISYDLAELARTLEASPELPKPILIRIEAEEADKANTLIGGERTDVEDSAFFHLSDLEPEATLTFSASVTWVAYASAAFFSCFLVLALWRSLSLPWRLEKARLKKEVSDTPAPRDPQEVQRQYDKSKPWLGLIALLPIFVIVAGSSLLRPALSQTVRLFTFSAPEPRWMVVGVILLAGAPYGISRLIYQIDKRRRMRRDPELAEALKAPMPVNPHAPPSLRLMPLVMIPLFLMVLLLPSIPGFRTISATSRRFIIFGVMGSTLVGFGLASRHLNRKWKPAREPDDWVYETAHEFAHTAGVKVRRVETLPSDSANAYVNLFGTVGVTTALLEKFEPDEVRAVVAHEIGHMKARHLHKLVPLSLGISAALCVGLYYGLSFLQGKVSDSVMRILSGPIIFMLPFPLITAAILGGRRKRNEHEADLFAVQVTGDPELVIRSLIKIHTVNEAPFRLKPIHEALSSHPSLENRIKAIREMHPDPGQA